MSGLRRALIAWGALCLVVAAILLVAGAVIPLAIDLAVGGIVVIAALLFERWRYTPRIDRTRGHWEETGERFVDPTSGHLIEVHYNPDTGQRAYVDTSSEDKQL